tara:strand:+ start:1112 stop:1522 length:411 start_codon:yes stop_codon:yes gene_type:complete
MSREDNVDKIKSYIEDVLGTKSSLRKKLPAKKSKEKELFCEMLQNLQFVNSRTMGMKHDYKVNMMDYDDPFYIALENLIQLHYTQEQQNVINWWLYDKFLPTGEVLILTNKETEEVIPSETPEDIWDLIQEKKKKK